tara:strand:- start:13 stop:267 length:255 start_codon:yes stop_codon:yes gene_type:complete
MSGPFKMKGSSGLGYGNQHSEGKSPAPYATPAKKGNITKDLKKKTKTTETPKGKKEELNEFGETSVQYKARMKEMGLQNVKSND